MADFVKTTPSALARRSPAERESLKRYWRSNIRILCILLLIWAAAGLGAGILWADTLNQFRLPGTAFPLGFWFAQQGSIFVFVLLILIYCILMNRLDAKHHAELVAIRKQEKASK